MSLWQRIRETRDQIARIERALKTQRKEAGEHHDSLARQQRESVDRLLRQLSAQQRTALDAQEAAVAALSRQIAGIAEALAAQGPRIDEQGSAVTKRVAAVGDLVSAAQRSLDLAHAAGERLEEGVGRLHGQLKRVMARVSRLGGTYDVATDQRFLEIADPLRDSKRTMLGYDRLFTLWQAAHNAARLGRPAVEIGTFRGGSAALIAEGLRSGGAAAVELHVVDTFEGHLDDSFTGHDVADQRGKFRETSFDDVRTFLAVYPGVTVHQGDAGAVIQTWPERRYGLVHIDVDLYGPTRDCLAYFGPRMDVGGVLVMDDYGSPTCPGVDTATGEFVAAHPEFQTWKLEAEQMVLVKTADR